MNKQETPPYRILVKGGEGEIIEKKSKFITTICKVETEEEATAFIDGMKKKNWNATHNCSAFVIGGRAELCRCSDDGEPSGTAGRPMLEVLLGDGVRNIAVVVTRYFGGTLLGTGGLVRAYTQAVKAGLENCEIGVMRYGHEVMVETDYNGIGKLQYLLRQRGIEPISSEYTDIIRLKLLFPAEDAKELEKEMIEATSGKVIWDKTNEFYYIDKE